MAESHYYDNDTFTPNLKDISGNSSIMYLYDPSYTPLAGASADYHTNTDLSYVLFHNQILSISDEIVTRGVGKITDASYEKFDGVNEFKNYSFDISGMPFLGNYSVQEQTAVFDLFTYKKYEYYKAVPIDSNGTTYYLDKLDDTTYSTYDVDLNIPIEIKYENNEWVLYNNSVLVDPLTKYNEPDTLYKYYTRIQNYVYPDSSGNVNNIVANRGDSGENPKQITDEIRINTISVTTFTYTVGSLTTTQDTTLTSTSYTADISTYKTITIGTSVKAIAADAFKSSTNLTSITFEQVSTLTSIGNNAFQSSGLTGTLILPGSLKTIGENAFQLCSNLTTIDFELDSLVDNGGAGTIGSNAFVDSGVTTFNARQTTIAANSWSTSPQTIGGKSIIINNLSPHTLYSYNDSTTSSTNVTTLGSSNNNTILTTAAIGPQVTIMSDDVFKDSTTLTSITFDSDIQLSTISTNAFHTSGLTGAITLPTSLTTIGSSAFQLCANITSVNFDELVLLTTIGVSAFEGSSSLNGTFPLPGTLISLGASAFKSCSSMTSITFDSNIQLSTISDSTFQSSGLTGAITLPTTLTTIGSSAFHFCSNMTSVNFDGLGWLTTIGVSAFEGCSGLTGAITLPISLTTIGVKSFHSCTSITSITFESGSLTSQGSSIGNDAFTNCTSLTTINAYQNTIDAMNWTPGASQSFYGITVTINNLSVVTEPTTFTLVDNSIITSSETIISGSSYNNNTNIKQVSIGESVESIADKAFLGKTDLETLFFNVNNISFITIGSEAFKSSGLVGAVSLPTTLTTIGSSAFQLCSKMTSVNFDELVLLTTIGVSAFEDCSGLNGDITLPASLMTIGSRAFHSCTSITSITFGSGSLTSGGSIGNDAFTNCTSLTTINAYQNTIDAMSWTPGANQSFYGITVTIINLSTTVFTYTDNTTSTTEDTILTTDSYDNTKILLKINIGPSVIQIGASNLDSYQKAAFFSNNNDIGLTGSLTSLTFSPNSKLETIDSSAFTNCTKLGGNLTIPKSVGIIGANAFKNCGKINLSFESGSQLSKINNNTFNGTGLSGIITIPASVTELGPSCFFDSRGDYSIKFEAGSLLTNIADYAFYDTNGSNGLRHITLPSSLKTIGALAFQDCDLMKSVTFEEGSLTGNGVSISTNIFNKCDGLTHIYAYNDTIQAMGWTAGQQQSIGGKSVTVESLS
jgi:hypothetical protein